MQHGGTIMSARKDRKIKIKTEFIVPMNDLFIEFSGQLSDGYWENSGGDFGTYEDQYYPDIYNCFNFNVEYNPDRFDYDFVITLKKNPTYNDAKNDCNKFHSMTDSQIIEYLKDAITHSIEDYPKAFSHSFTEYELEVLVKCMDNWEIIPPPLPKMTHNELVKLVGHDFEYVKGQ